MAQPVVARTRRAVVAMKAETTYGTDSLGTVTAADILWAFNIRPTSRIEAIEMLAQSGFLGRLRSMSGVEVFGLTFDIQVRGAGAAYSASVVPDIHNPLRAAGMLATLDATPSAEKYTYTPRSSGFESFTVKVVHENGPTHIGLGCFGNVAFRGVAGQPGIASVTLAGILAAEGTLALVTKAPTTLQPPVLKSAAFQIDAANFAANVQNVALDLGAAVNVQEGMNAAGGLAGLFIADRDPGGSFDPEVVAAATYDWFTKWKDKPAAVDLGWQWGAAQYNRCKVTMPEITIQERAWGERNAMRAFDVAYKA
ncbi:MAG: phage tail tube protein, partial [Rhodospirillales bacterium]